MSYFILGWSICFILGLVAVAANPAPYFAAFGLVVSSGVGCALLAMSGSSFLALVLFLIYLGGMLVVFGYSAALAADAYPESWGDASVFEHMVMYLILVGGAGVWVGSNWYDPCSGLLSSCKELMVVRGDLGGVAALYSSGGIMMAVCVWVLLVTLFVVLELTRGLSRGTLRAV
uniref:NADH-ubiquinone oxidoreductase chain 6 n=1 Tax=Spratelloides delicatulus TaxID=373251 RepID=A5PIN6_9TELE|nr:NADH dehydrogenase subunit 6 [Spratelloides delicatulus]BAF64125.1 NADH dehydrogenase subunit 6 [Spratelloides delicatulus]